MKPVAGDSGRVYAAVTLVKSPHSGENTGRMGD